MLIFSRISEMCNFSNFDCGQASLNQFIRHLALLNQERRLGATTVLTSDEDVKKEVMGFYTLCFCHIEKENLPKTFGGNLPNPIPAIKLARLAVDLKYRRRGYGELLLAHALRCSFNLSEKWGGYVVLVDAKEEAKGFYAHYGIKEIKQSPDLCLMGIRTKDIPKHFS